MIVVRSLTSCIAALRRLGVTEESLLGVTIGQFDSFHLGHQKLFSTLTNELAARSTKGQRYYKVLLTLAPSPRRFFSQVKQSAIADHPELWTVSALRDRIELAREAGFDLFFIARFNSKFAALSPEKFIRDYIVFGLSARVVVVGHDWAFGKGRIGTVETLRSLGQSNWFDVTVVEPQMISGERVSTSGVKAALQAGDLERVSQFLGRRFSLSGRVRHGDARGRDLGFPTANIEFQGQVIPRDGVYATRVIVAGKDFAAATNIGVRPTFQSAGNVNRRIVEAHLIPTSRSEFSSEVISSDAVNLYGRRLRVEFLARLRDEKRFESVSDLQSAIRADIEQTRSIYDRAMSNESF